MCFSINDHQSAKKRSVSMPANQRRSAALMEASVLTEAFLPRHAVQLIALQGHRVSHFIRAKRFRIEEQSIHVKAYAANHIVLPSSAVSAVSIPSTAADTMPPA